MGIKSVLAKIRRFKSASKDIIVYTTLFFFIISFLAFPQSSKSVIGIVTDGNDPIAGAIVRWQATANSVVTDNNGMFELELISNRVSHLITAWKQGYYNGGTNYENGVQKIEIVLAPLPEKDNTAYEWVDPVPNPDDDIKNCGDCHASIIYDQWVNNGHAQSAINPLFLSIYNGTDAQGNNGIQPGYKLDFPHSFGNCANCHAPTSAINNIYGVDLNKLEGVDKLGVSCDFCHKIKDVKLKENTSAYTGVMHMELMRPPDGHQMFFGPYDDVPDPDAYSENISKSIFCAPCHQGGYWGIPIYESYTEWLLSPYAEEGIECQDCHMPPDGVTSNFAPGKGGNERDPLTIPTHLQLGSRDKDFLISSVELRATSSMSGGKINLKVEIENVGAGHHVPTDSPMRNMILVVKAYDSKGKNLTYSGENLIPIWGGRGKISEGNYEGLPGKGFAKILFEDWTPYVPLKVNTRGEQMFPAPQWRTVKIKQDTRIPALATDVSNYRFLIADQKGPYTIECKLIYRRMFKNWADMKKWELDDIELAEKVIKIN